MFILLPVKWLLFSLFTLNALAASFAVEPRTVRQGEVLRVQGDGPAVSARLDQRTIRLFAQTNGPALGLMPVGVLAKPGTYSLEWLDEQGSVVKRAPVTIVNAHYAKQNIVLTKALSALHSTSDERQRVGVFLNEVSPVRYWEDPLEPPLPGCITSPFGVIRLHNGKPTGDYHAGLDQRGPLGSPIHAVAAGVVKIVQPFELRGGTVAIDHGQGLASIYLHMSGFAVKEGGHVKRGDVIGYVGSTGRSTGPHLHWTLYANGLPVSPSQWIKLANCATAHMRPKAKRPIARNK